MGCCPDLSLLHYNCDNVRGRFILNGEHAVQQGFLIHPKHVDASAEKLNFNLIRDKSNISSVTFDLPCLMQISAANDNKSSA
jgi:hypothetical protein